MLGMSPRPRVINTPTPVRKEQLGSGLQKLGGEGLPDNTPQEGKGFVEMNRIIREEAARLGAGNQINHMEIYQLN